MAEGEFNSSSRTKRIIGRKKELAAIRNAISDRISRLLMFVGKGGMGKTRLLEEVERLAKASRKVRVRCSGIIDAYHPEAHTDLGIQDLLIQRLDPSGTYFIAYRKKEKAYRQHVAEGLTGKALEQERIQLEQAFLRGYKRLARDYRIVLAFDTLELIEYEAEAVQRLCQIEQETTTLKNWLLQRVPRFPNTVTILAGRTTKLPLAGTTATPEETPVWDEFERGFEKRRFFEPAQDRFELGPFTPQEAEEYFQDLSKQNPGLREIKPEERQKLYERAEWRPIRLSLVIDLCLHGGTLEWLHDQSKPFDEQVVEMWLGLEGLTQIVLLYLPAARKGLNADLMYFLEPDLCTQEEWGKHLTAMKKLAFIKSHPDTDLLFLHDELYQIFEQASALRRREEARLLYGKIAKYYRNCAANVDARLEAMGDEPFEKKESLLNERGKYLLALLHYELQIDPTKGFQECYTRWDDEAIEQHDIDLDNRLRDELWRFLSSPVAQLPQVKEKIHLDAINLDSAARWVRRYIAREDFERARQVAEAISQSKDKLFKTKDPLFWADLYCARGEAQLYLNAPAADPLNTLNKSIRLLKRQATAADGDTWRSDRIMGRAYNDLGFYWSQVGSVTKMLEAYRHAIPYQERLPVERANTLTNLAFELGKLGRIEFAQPFIDDAIRLRKRLGHPFLLALSYNVQGYIHVLNDQPAWGAESCKQALAIFQRLHDSRGIGLALIGLGFAYRKTADQWKLGVYPKEQAEKNFAQSEKYLQDAQMIFRNKVKEPFQLWNAYNELGSTYCDWGFLLEKLNRPVEARDKRQLSVIAQQEALDLARQNKFVQQEINSLDDLAQVCRDMGDTVKAQESLAQISGKIPTEYRLVHGSGFQSVRDPDETYWLALGKFHLQHGIWSFHDLIGCPNESGKLQLLQAAIENYCLAYAYFVRYWPSSYNSGLTIRSFANHLREVGSDCRGEVRNLIRQTARDYSVNLEPLRETLDNTLGI